MSITLQAMILKLRKAGEDVEDVLMEACEEATKRAVQVAAENTPPKAGTGRMAGTGMLTGNLKAGWAKDSETRPQKQGNKYVTSLNNNMSYASYVENGHRMARHFVPGLIINPYTGELEKDPDGEGGIIVGTKTFWVKGEFMGDKGAKEYEKAVEEIVAGKVADLLK